MQFPASDLRPYVPVWAAGVWAVGQLARRSGIVYLCTAARVATDTDEPSVDTGSWSPLGGTSGGGGISLSPVGSAIDISGSSTTGPAMSALNDLILLEVEYDRGGESNVRFSGLLRKADVGASSSATYKFQLQGGGGAYIDIYQASSNLTFGAAYSGYSNLTIRIYNVAGSGSAGTTLSAYLASASLTNRVLTLTDQDGTATTVPYNLVPAWSSGVWAVGELARHGGTVYQCTAARTATDTSDPATDTSSWSALGAGTTAAGGRPTITRVNPSATDDATDGGRAAQTVWALASDARTAIAAIASPTAGDFAYFRVRLSSTIDQIFMYVRHGGAWIPTGSAPTIQRASTSGVLQAEVLVDTWLDVPLWSPSHSYPEDAVVRYFSELWIKVVTDDADRSEPSHAIAQDPLQRTIWQPLNLVSASEVPAAEDVPGTAGLRSVQDYINYFLAERGPFEPVTLFDGSVQLLDNQRWVEVDLNGSSRWDTFDAIHISYPLREDPLLAQTYLKSDFERLHSQRADGTNTWYSDTERSALFLVDQGGAGLAIGVTTDRGKLLFAHSTNAAPASATMEITGLNFGGQRGPEGRRVEFSPADLHTAYFPENNQTYALPDAAGDWSIDILDPVNIALALVDGDSFIVHGIASGLAAVNTCNMRIKGRTETTVTTDSLPVTASESFYTLTLNTPGEEEDRTWVLELSGTKGATTSASIGFNLREVVGVRGGDEPDFVKAVARMIEDYVYHRLALQYGVTVYENNRYYVRDQVVIDLADHNLYRFTGFGGHSTAAPNTGPGYWERITWPQPANWALEDRDPSGIQMVPPSRIRYRLPPAYDAATEWPNASEVLHDHAIWRNTSGGALTGVEPGATGESRWTRVETFSSSDIAEVAPFALQSNVEADDPSPVPSALLDLELSWIGHSNPPDPADAQDRALYLSTRGGNSPLLRGATTERAGLMTAADRTNLSALLARRGFNWRGEWSATTTYQRNDVVHYHETDINPEADGLHIANRESTGVFPTFLAHTDDWDTLIYALNYTPQSMARGMEAENGDNRLSYTALKDRPTIPVVPDTSQPWPTRPASYPYSLLTGAPVIPPGAATPDWNAAADAPGYIANKPTIPTVPDEGAPWPTPPSSFPWEDISGKPTIPTPSNPRGLWADGTTYRVRDTVYDYNAETGVTIVAEAIAEHAATLSNRPAGLDANSDEWHIIARVNQSPHARTTDLLDARITEVAPEQPTIPGPSDWWRGPWVSTNSYSAGEIAAFENAWYRADVDIPAGGGIPEADTTRWTEIMRLELQLTTEGVLRYRLDFHAPVGGQDTSWDDIPGGLIIWRGEWTVGATYNAENLVTRDGYIWRATAGHAAAGGAAYNGPGSSETRWVRFGPYVPDSAHARTMIWYGDWVSNVAFPEGWVVRRSGNLYIALTDVSAGIEPGSAQDVNHWEQM